MERVILYLLDKQTVIDTINKLFIFTDNKDWESVKNCFTDKVYFDMTSMAGGEPSELTPQQIVDAWDEGLKAINHIHHQAGNYLVDVKENTAVVFCYATAGHYVKAQTGGYSKTFVGSYNFELLKSNAEWKVSKFKFNLKYVQNI